MPELTHVDAAGDARMVDVSGKDETARVAVATGQIRMGPEALAAIVERRAAKGDVLLIAQLAGIQGAKRTSDLIPLCHPLPLSGVSVALEVVGDAVVATATAKTTGRTGVEMEALTAVMAALLTVYDMLKAVDRGMCIEGVRLLSKDGGRSGAWTAR
jgi:cyclic pyranopterin phosphate synthase